MITNQDPEQMIAWLPDLLFTAGRFERGSALVCDSGMITRIARVDELKDEKRIRLSNRAMLPGLVNAHSHAFQRVLRGRTEHRTPFRVGLSPDRAGSSPPLNSEKARDSFWTWRELMYSAAARLTPEDIYDAS